MLSKQALQEFKEIWREEGLGQISDEAITAEAINLLNLFNVIHRPVKKEWLS